ncbi:rhomboid family intramembrane serine protease [Mechercharimyces sp. CAU 1602]|uniref:rhomboid family intramembrane serine protease n=1 Tax=Mechercharimyces sp. CAU 1602 TaxID=2973933 RepID=UPI002161BB5D|nr:rhomboid family intramembrane serine protease [Mechercharimyces sp. CAU 1602]MCS1350201.1 rhomboid family intramembrane serine protease [Mechercharimyces sp. CAU 1602]
MFQHTQIPFKQFPKHFPLVTAILSIQVVLFILMTLAGGSTRGDVLIAFGALDVAQAEQWWRMFTSIFLHIGFMHLLFNSFALYLFGPQLEWAFGRVWFVTLYLFCGFMGSAATLYLQDYGVSAGASGSIYGLLGVYVYLYLFRKDVMDRDTGKGIIVLLGINLLLSFMPGINAIAHIAGLVAGFIFTGLMLMMRRTS